MNISDVLCTNYGTKSWKLTSPDDYSALEWYDASEKPTEEKLRSELTTLENAEPMRRLRIRRDALLKETDWTQGADVPNSIKSPYQTYRQALRDFPSDASKWTMDDNGMLSINWPTPPS